MRKLTPAVNWKRLPFIRITLPVILGISLAEFFDIHSSFLHFLTISSFLGFLYFIRKRQAFPKKWLAGIAINLFLVLGGCQLVQYHSDLNDELHFQNHLTTENHIIGIVEKASRTQKGKLKIALNTEFIKNSTNEIIECKGKLLAYLGEDNCSPELKYGDQLIIKGKIIAIQKAKNPYTFDYSNYLGLQNIHFQTFILPDKWKVIQSNEGSIFQKKVILVRNHFLTVLKKHIGTNEEVTIASALLLGYKDELSQDLKKAYADSGAIHVLAVSGLHIGIVSGLFLLLLKLFPFKGHRWNILKLGITLTSVWLFAILTGLSPSVQRASIMFSIYYTAKILERESNNYNTLATSALFILLFNPFALFEVGFQFSFLAVLGIAFFMPKFLKVWNPKQKVLSYFWKISLAGVSAQLAIFPLCLYYFHQFPTYFWLTGLFVIPFAMAILYGGILLLFFSFISQTLADLLGQFLSTLISIQNYLIDYTQQLPVTILDGFWLSTWQVILLYGFLLGVTICLFTKKIRLMIPALCCLLLGSCVQLRTAYNQVNQKKIIIYAVAKNSVIDFVDGTNTYELAKYPLTEEQQIYTTQNNRLAMGIKEIIPIDTTSLEKQNLKRKGTHFQFGDKRLEFLNQSLPTTFPKQSIDCDYLIVQNDPQFDIIHLKKYFNFKEIIFDGSNSHKNINRWKKACQELRWIYWDIPSEGAYVIDLTEESKKVETRSEPINFIELKNLHAEK